MAYSLIWNQTLGGNFDDNQGEQYFGNEFNANTAVIGKAITKTTVSLKKIGSPTSSIKGHLWFGSDPQNPDVTSNETYYAADVGTGATTLTFTFTNTTVSASDTLCGFGFSATGSGPDHFKYERTISGAQDGTYLGKGNTTSWSYPDSKGACLTQAIYEGGVTPGSGTLLPPSPAYVRL